MTGTPRRPRFVVDVAVAPGFIRKLGDGAGVLRAAAVATLAQERPRGRAELTLAVTGDTAVRALNRRFRGVDATTDVLAFPAGAESAPDLADYLGDVAVSYPQAARQALAAGHATLAELQLLVVHGVLHLLGYDHATAAGRRRMWAAQRRALRTLGAAVTEPAPASQMEHD
jgi:probable rRNA maturation factor